MANVMTNVRVAASEDSSAAASDPASWTTGFRHVLVCLDRSEAAEAVLPLACHLARVDRAKITLVNVIDERQSTSELRAVDALEWEIVREDAHAYLQRLAEHTQRQGIEAEGRVAEGVAPQRIARLEGELEADLIVLSTIGEGGLNVWQLGGTARKILALAHGPVLVVPIGTGEPEPHVPPRRILVPLDGSLRSECVLPVAVRLARATETEIVVAHVVSDPVHTGVLSDVGDVELAAKLADRLAARAQEYLQRIRERLLGSGARAKAAVGRSTDFREGLVTLAAAESADLVIMSAHGSVCNPRSRFGSVTSFVIAHSNLPVLVIQDLPNGSNHPTSRRTSRLPPRSVDAAPTDA